MIEIISPARYVRGPESRLWPSVFLAGSIEQGQAEEWQKFVIEQLADLNCIVYNPRRIEWDATWEQSKDNPEFLRQVNWELDHLHSSDIQFFYFSPGTKAPVTMLEFGLVADKPHSNIVCCCPDGFWRKGNIEITCSWVGIEQPFNDLTAAVNDLKDMIKRLS